MNCEMKRVDENTVVMKTEKGNTVTLRFKPEDNPEIEDIITDNLLTSYERRIRAQAKINHEKVNRNS